MHGGGSCHLWYRYSLGVSRVRVHAWLLVCACVFVCEHPDRCIWNGSLEANVPAVPINHPTKILTCRSRSLCMSGEGAHETSSLDCGRVTLMSLCTPRTCFFFLVWVEQSRSFWVLREVLGMQHKTHVLFSIPESCIAASFKDIYSEWPT